MQKKYTEISYQLEDLDDEEEGESDEEGKGDDEGSAEVVVQGRTGTSVIKSSRLRSKAEQQKDKINEDQEQKDH